MPDSSEPHGSHDGRGVKGLSVVLAIELSVSGTRDSDKGQGQAGFQRLPGPCPSSPQKPTGGTVRGLQ